jgi:hypothetical protein
VSFRCNIVIKVFYVTPSGLILRKLLGYAIWHGYLMSPVNVLSSLSLKYATYNYGWLDCHFIPMLSRKIWRGTHDNTRKSKSSQQLKTKWEKIWFLRLLQQLWLQLPLSYYYRSSSCSSWREQGFVLKATSPLQLYVLKPLKLCLDNLPSP